MKNLFLSLLLCLLVVSCSKDDEQQSPLNPPTWLMGEWKDMDTGGTHLFKFTENNFIFTQMNIVTNFAELAKGSVYTIQEVINTNEVYQVDKALIITTGLDSKESYKFKKQVDGTIEFSFDIPLTPVLTLIRVN